MNHEDHINTLLEEIRRERAADEISPRIQAPAFNTPRDLLAFLRSQPITRVVEVTTLSSFLRRYRSSLGITIQTAAQALGINVDELKNLESIDCLPWLLSARSVANILRSYRIHINAMEYLTQNSFEVAKVSGRISDANEATEAISVWLSTVKSELKSQNENALLN